MKDEYQHHRVTSFALPHDTDDDNDAGSNSDTDTNKVKINFEKQLGQAISLISSCNLDCNIKELAFEDGQLVKRIFIKEFGSQVFSQLCSDQQVRVIHNTELSMVLRAPVGIARLAFQKNVSKIETGACRQHCHPFEKISRNNHLQQQQGIHLFHGHDSVIVKISKTNIPNRKSETFSCYHQEYNEGYILKRLHSMQQKQLQISSSFSSRQGIIQNDTYHQDHHHYDECFYQNQILIRPYYGVGLDKLLLPSSGASCGEYVEACNQINLSSVMKISTELAREICFLKLCGIVHGDVNLQNVVVCVVGEQQHDTENGEDKASRTKTRRKFCTNLEDVLRELYCPEEVSIQLGQDQVARNTISAGLVDYGNSFFVDQKQECRSEQLRKSNGLAPTQTLSYRSPQALFSRGGSEIDVWGLGHIMFSLLTGSDIFQSEQTQLEAQTLQDCFFLKDSQLEWKKIISTRVERFCLFQESVMKELTQLILLCLEINSKKRISAEQCLGKLIKMSKKYFNIEQQNYLETRINSEQMLSRCHQKQIN